MGGPIEEFLEEIGDGSTTSTLLELRVHLEESASNFIEIGFCQFDAERAAIELLGKRTNVQEVVREQSSNWKSLVAGDRRILLLVWAVTSLTLLIGPMLVATKIIGIEVAQPVVLAYYGIVLWTLWQSSRANRVGPFSITLAVALGMLTSLLLCSLFLSQVPIEVGGWAYRWDLAQKHSDYMLYSGEFWNSSVHGYYSLVKPGDLAYDVAKQDMWRATGGAGIIQSLGSWLRTSSLAFGPWLVLCLVCGIAGFFVRFVREGGFRSCDGLKLN